jgi:hypothetical protein
MLLVKDGVTFIPNLGGFLILQAMKTVSKMIEKNLTITSGSDGEHSGQDDPHKHGKAYDFRSHDLDDITKQQVLANLNNLLGREKFYFFLESPNTLIEHFHIQVKKEIEFTLQDFLEV